MSIYNDVISFLGPLIGGGAALGASLNISKKTGKLKETDLSAEGIVFQLQYSSDVTTGDDDILSSTSGSYPVIRFLTAEQVRIIGKPSSFVHSRYKEGQAVKVIYNKEEPAEFIIDSKLNNILAPVFQGIGVILLLISLVIFCHGLISPILYNLVNQLA